MQVGPYNCNLSVDEKPLEEYGHNEDKDSKQSTCWVPSEEGCPFRIECSFGGTLSDTHAMRLVLSADGEILDTRIACEADSTTMSGLRLNSWTILPYVFKPAVKPTEDFDDDEMDTEDLQNPAWKKRGVITLEMTRVEVMRSEPLDDDQPSSPLPEAERLRTIQVGEKDISPRKTSRRSVSWLWGEDGSRPCAVFHFKHRPKEWLEAYGFIEVPKPDVVDMINFDMFGLNHQQPEYITGMKEMTLRDSVMS
ncbi:hypothetical protein CALCODRAFT_497340 [Calocera cornea HHB12733]|uniref:DUF7918 domain-containing protein n=1 Tax=Calocera cornea HHB12733 TaxID=1353952 RepID=A0A165FCH7_9BASI|nr:hypothetical protein CALCODRAFT_497340 [Calocera cornea HHB12733]